MTNDRNFENVLVLQGGGSLGAFSCGVYKAFVASGIKINIVAGTSIGAINGAIIAGSKNDRPEIELERFWLELGENSVDLRFSGFGHGTQDDGNSENPYSQYYRGASAALHNILSFYSSAIYGNDAMFIPRWRPDRAATDRLYFKPEQWTYIYDHSPLAKTLEKYVDYDRLRPGGNVHARLIITAVNVLTAEPLTFDSSKEPITIKHLLGSSGYPLYGFPWVKVNDGIYAWDGSLLSNTPFREAIDAAPINDKNVFIVENYPRAIERLPQNMPEVYHRARDIMFSDKTAHNMKMSKVITRYLRFIAELYEMIEDNCDLGKIEKKKRESIQTRYRKIMKEHGAEIKKIAYITRDEKYPYLYENTDFTPQGIRNLIKEGESKTSQVIKKMGL
ncbi:MAG: patatin-like phospholipase family protein [Nitrososphaera sp.]|nr:patatin-like phospholipase family protein [Nitrososphaera sp.]